MDTTKYISPEALIQKVKEYASDPSIPLWEDMYYPQLTYSDMTTYEFPIMGSIDNYPHIAVLYPNITLNKLLTAKDENFQTAAGALFDIQSSKTVNGLTFDNEQLQAYTIRIKPITENNQTYLLVKKEIQTIITQNAFQGITYNTNVIRTSWNDAQNQDGYATVALYYMVESVTAKQLQTVLTASQQLQDFLTNKKLQDALNNLPQKMKTINNNILAIQTEQQRASTLHTNTFKQMGDLIQRLNNLQAQLNDSKQDRIKQTSLTAGQIEDIKKTIKRTNNIRRTIISRNTKLQNNIRHIQPTTRHINSTIHTTTTIHIRLPKTNRI